MKLFGRKVSSIKVLHDKMEAKIIYTFDFANGYRVHVTKNDNSLEYEYYSVERVDTRQEICHASTWLDTETLTKYLNNIESLGDF